MPRDIARASRLPRRQPPVDRDLLRIPGRRHHAIDRLRVARRHSRARDPVRDPPASTRAPAAVDPLRSRQRHVRGRRRDRHLPDQPAGTVACGRLLSRGVSTRRRRATASDAVRGRARPESSAHRRSDLHPGLRTPPVDVPDGPGRTRFRQPRNAYRERPLSRDGRRPARRLRRVLRVAGVAHSGIPLSHRRSARAHARRRGLRVELQRVHVGRLGRLHLDAVVRPLGGGGPPPVDARPVEGATRTGPARCGRPHHRARGGAADRTGRVARSAATGQAVRRLCRRRDR